MTTGFGTRPRLADGDPSRDVVGAGQNHHLRTDRNAVADSDVAAEVRWHSALNQQSLPMLSLS
jgi:hypothetical protein